jgi:hypothetical protein
LDKYRQVQPLPVTPPKNNKSMHHHHQPMATNAKVRLFSDENAPSKDEKEAAAIMMSLSQESNI